MSCSSSFCSSERSAFRSLLAPSGAAPGNSARASPAITTRRPARGDRGRHRKGPFILMKHIKVERPTGRVHPKRLRRPSLRQVSLTGAGPNRRHRGRLTGATLPYPFRRPPSLGYPPRSHKPSRTASAQISTFLQAHRYATGLENLVRCWAYLTRQSYRLPDCTCPRLRCPTGC